MIRRAVARAHLTCCCRRSVRPAPLSCRSDIWRDGSSVGL